MKIRLNDSVIVRTGEDRGKVGVVTKILKKMDRLIVEGVNQHIKHVKGRGDKPGERVSFFAPIHVSNVSLIDPKSGEATRIRYETKGKMKVRVAVKSKQEITGREKHAEVKAKKQEKEKKEKPTASSKKTSKKSKE